MIKQFGGRACAALWDGSAGADAAELQAGERARDIAAEQLCVAAVDRDPRLESDPRLEEARRQKRDCDAYLEQGLARREWAHGLKVPPPARARALHMTRTETHTHLLCKCADFHALLGDTLQRQTCVAV